MSFSRINYDEGAYDLRMNRSTAPGNYRLFPEYADICGKCYPYNGPLNSKEHSSMARGNCETGFGKLADVESDITNRRNYLDNSNKRGKNDDYKKAKIYNKPLCDKTLEGQDTRFTHPLDNYRGMSLTNFYFTPYLHVNPQNIIQTDQHREGSSTRQMVKDCYKLPDQEFWDKGQGLPPKPEPIKKKNCKSCCT